MLEGEGDRLVDTLLLVGAVYKGGVKGLASLAGDLSLARLAGRGETFSLPGLRGLPGLPPEEPL